MERHQLQAMTALATGSNSPVHRRKREALAMYMANAQASIAEAANNAADAASTGASATPSTNGAIPVHSNPTVWTRTAEIR